MGKPKYSRATRTRLDSLPGHYARRLNQIAVALFFQETEPWGVTPVQYAAMQSIFHNPDLDQRKLARSIGFDSSTITGVVDRLEARGLVRRMQSPSDRRVRLLSLTQEGMGLLDEMIPAMLRSQKRLLEPLTDDDRIEFMRMLRALVIANNGMSRAPSDNE